jgi:hypothetical protein
MSASQSDSSVRLRAAVALCTCLAIGALPVTGETPTDTLRIPPLDLPAIRAEDAQRAAAGLPPRFAVDYPVLVRPDLAGEWDAPASGVRRWRLRVTSPAAVSLSFGFAGYWMPPGGRLLIRSADGAQRLRAFTAADNEAHGQLWTPVVHSDDVVLEAWLPASVEDACILELTSVNVGYRGLGATGGDRSGWCNIDVVCAEGDAWRDEIRSVGLITIMGTLYCSGFLVNNTAQDETPYFLTAEHCNIDAGNAATVVVYWNFESPTCGQQGGGSTAHAQSGAYLRASYQNTDFTLIELDDMPDPAFAVTYAGWNRTDADPLSAVTIHHPSGDEKSISFENDPCETTSHTGYTSPGDGTHIRVPDWDLGTTEPGSSGAPLFDQDQRAVGQLHGGFAACGNDESDWYGRLSVSWNYGLGAFLDPGGVGVATLDLLHPDAGIKVMPVDGLYSAGQPGGPFVPDTKQYTIENMGPTGIEYLVSCAEPWLSVTNGSDILPPGGVATVAVSLNAIAESLAPGLYSAALNFVNLTDQVGNTVREVKLQVGGPVAVYSFSMDTDPGWATEGLWAYGVPGGGGGQHGFPDPTSGYTGSAVYGYNLAGDYENNLPEQHLTTHALDCSQVTETTLRFYRWLGVERNIYDHAYVRISTDGASWTTLWENGSEITDDDWVLQEFDISDFADHQPTVYLRWTMGQTDGDWQFCGWNLDDVEVWGVVAALPNGACCHADGSCSLETELDCTGSWLGAGTSCDPNPCLAPVGACCYPDGGCLELPEGSCGGVWQGAATDCNPNPCPQPWCQGDADCSGACDFADIEYFVMAITGWNHWVTYYKTHHNGTLPPCPYEVNDTDGSGGVNFSDIVPFIERIGQPCLPLP